MNNELVRYAKIDHHMKREFLLLQGKFTESIDKTGLVG